MDYGTAHDLDNYLEDILRQNSGIDAAAAGDVSLHARAVVGIVTEVEEYSLQEASLNGSFFETQAHFERGIAGRVAEESLGGAGDVIMEETEVEEEHLEEDELEESLELARGGTGDAAKVSKGTVDTTGLQRHSDDPYLLKVASQTSDQLEPFSGMPHPPVEDSSAFPSSSASVAERLLSPRKRPSAANSSGGNGKGIASNHQELQSSADPDLSASVLLPGSRSSSGNNPSFMASGNPFGGNISGDHSFSGPTTSTPAGVFAAPHPLTASRTVPTIGLLPMQERLDSTPHTVSSPPPPKSTGFYQSSAAAKAIPPPQREKPIARQWFEDDDERSPEGASPDQLDETVVEDETVIDEEGEKDMTISESQGASRHGLEPVSNVGDESVDAPAVRDDPLDVVPPTQESVEPNPSSDQPLPAPRQISLDPSTSASDPPAAAQPRPLPSDPPQASTSRQSSALRQAVSELTTTDNSEGAMSLSGIGDLQSSMEIPSNYMPEMTQASPSAETFPHVNSSTRSPSPADSDKAEERSLPEFEVDTGVHGSDRQQHTNPRPGRELRRNPPPVTSEPEAQRSTPPKMSPASTVIVPATSPLPEPIAVEAIVTVVERRVQAIVQLPASTSKSVPAASVVPESNGDSVPAAAFSTLRNASPPVEETVVEPELVEESNQAVPSEGEKGAVPVEVEQDVVPALADVGKDVAAPVPAVQPKKVIAAKTKKGKGKAKGKEKVLAPPTDSPDALDLFRKSQKHPIQEVEQVEETIIEGGDEMEETNYDEYPTPQNGRKRAGRQHQPSSSPSVSTSASPRHKRQKMSEPIEAPRKRRASVSPSKSKGKATKDSHSSRGPSLPPRARSARPKRSLRELSTSAELSDLEVADDVATTSKAKRARANGTTSMVSKRARLSNKGSTSTMPFSRVFALWREDRYFYPGTITHVVGRACKILFDDDSEATVKFHDLRRCELKQGDVVRYRGDEEDPETQALTSELMVLRIERGEKGEDYSGELAKKDVMVGTKVVENFSAQQTMSKQRIDIEAICIPPEFTKKLDDRKFTELEVDQLSTLDPTAVSRALPVKAAKVVARNTPVANAVAVNLFAGFGFIVTRVVYDKPASSDASTSDEKLTSMASQEIIVEKAAFDRRLVKNGATIIDVDDLFAVDTHKPVKLVAKFASSKFSKLHTILLLADRPSTTPKYMVALALGIPCVSRLFIQASEDAGKGIDWKQFVITAGYSQALGTHAIGGQMKALTGNSFDLASFAKHHPAAALFHECSFVIVLPKKTERENQVATLRRILVAAGAQQVDFVHTVAEAKSGDKYDFVFLEDKQKISAALESHDGMANIEWMKQCLINGRVLEAERMKAVEA